MEGFIHDLRFGVRTLRKNLGFTLIAVVTLALGIGGNVAMFSVTSAVLFRELPYEDADRAMFLWRDGQRFDRVAFSIPTFQDWQERNRAFEALAVYRDADRNLVGGTGDPERVRTLLVTSEFAEALGVETLLGRFFTPREDQWGGERTAVISYGLWQRRYGGDPELVGRAINIDGEPFTVIGVLPPSLERQPLFDNMTTGDLWLPLGLFSKDIGGESRDNHQVVGIGRLRPDVSVEAALADMRRITLELAEEFPDIYKDNLLNGDQLRSELRRDAIPILWPLLAAVGSVLLIACLNLVNLILTRNAHRHRELATRQALGAGNGLLVRQLVTESLLLALLGGALGIWIGSLALRMVLHWLGDVLAVEGATLDFPVLAVTAGLTLAVGLLIGLVPALQMLRQSRRSDAVGGGHGGLLSRAVMPRQRLRQALVVMELAAALVLLVGAGLMLGTLQQLTRTEPGFETDRVLVLQVVLPQAKAGDRESWLSYFDQALERVRALPDVSEAAATTAVPIKEDGQVGSIAAAGDRPVPEPHEMESVLLQLVSPSYFRTMGIPMVATGAESRDFDLQDHERTGSEPVAIVSRSLAQFFWPGKTAVGQRISFEFTRAPDDKKLQPYWRRIVGVVEDARLTSLRTEPEHAVYAPYTQTSPMLNRLMPRYLIVKSRDEIAGLSERIRDILLEMDPQQPVFGIQRLEAVLSNEFSEPEVLSSFLRALALLAIVLAVIGIYGVVSYNMVARQHELGIRSAIGATRGRLLAAFLLQSLVMIGTGVGLGLLAAAFLSRFLSSQLYGVSPLAPGIYLTVAAGLAATALLATLWPSWRAANIEPAQILRHD